MLTIKDKDVVNGVYTGRDFDLEDVVIVPAKMKRITFPFPINIKGMMTGTGVNVICDDEAKIRHLQMGGGGLFRKNLFCGALEAQDTIITIQDLVSWMGDLVSHNGNLIAGGQLISSGDVQARNGAIVSETSITAEGKIFSLNTWTPKHGKAKIGLAALALKEAKALYDL